MRRIQKTLTGNFVISEGGSWLPGVYNSLEAAKAAFEFDWEFLLELRDKVNRKPGNLNITVDDILDLINTK